MSGWDLPPCAVRGVCLRVLFKEFSKSRVWKAKETCPGGRLLDHMDASGLPTIHEQDFSHRDEPCD